MNYFDKLMSKIVFPDIERLNGETVLITGATGLIGSSLTRYLVAKGINVICAARNLEKAKSFDFYDRVTWVIMDMVDRYQLDNNISYIIHAASPTDSGYFVSNPVETLKTTTFGLYNLLEFARTKNIKSFVFISSLEVYGICNNDCFLKENEFYSLDPINVRNSYSEGKKYLELLCSSYCSEYGLPIKIVRLGQTFGPGVKKDDNRVFAQFGRSVVQNQNITLSTKGETKRSYCSIPDAIQGILVVLLNGINGEAYNVASDDSYCSIYELAAYFVRGTELEIIISEQHNNIWFVH